MTTHVILIRHGQTAWNASEERFRGRTDLPLNETGLEQARRIAARLANENIDAIYSSPLQRTLQTIQPLADARGMNIIKTEALNDMDVGVCAGMTFTEAQHAFPQAMDDWKNHPARMQFPNGESMSAVHERLEKLVAELLVKHHEQTIALVTHRILCHATLCLALGLDLDLLWRIKQDNACVNFFEMRESHFAITLMNDTAHLSGLH